MKFFIRLIISLFKNDNQDQGKTETRPIEIPSSKTGIKKIALLVGHGAGDSGAVCRRNRMEEHHYNSMIAEMIKQSDTTKEIKVFYKTNGTGWTGTYPKVAIFNPDLTIELHLNDADVPAVGCEVLCIEKDLESGSVGKKFASMFSKEFSRKIRGDQGIKWMSKGGRGYGNLVGAKATSKRSILVEPFFINTDSEWIEPSTYAEFFKKFLNEL